jgi:hypothetical protein
MIDDLPGRFDDPPVICAVAVAIFDR